MSKKAHKKLREVARLHSLYSGSAVSAIDTGTVSKEAFINPVLNQRNSGSNEISHVEVGRDLRYLGLVWVVMIGLLLTLDWLVTNTSFATTIINLGHRIVS